MGGAFRIAPPLTVADDEIDLGVTTCATWCATR
jgi:4-aminobutyrate aminotransferase-like enzyme